MNCRHLAPLLFAMTVVMGASKPQNQLTTSPKDVVRNFYRLAFVDHKAKEAAETYLADSYIQHNPNVPTGRQPFIDYFVPFFQKHPDAASDIKRIIADGDMVALHVHSKSGKGDLGRAIVDIFRVKDGKIVEHWDVIQAVPQHMAHGNGMF